MFASVRARAPRGTKNGREEKIRSVEQKGPRLSPSHAKKVEERGENRGEELSRPPLDVTRRIRGTVVSMLMSVPRFSVRGRRVCTAAKLFQIFPNARRGEGRSAARLEIMELSMHPRCSPHVVVHACA